MIIVTLILFVVIIFLMHMLFKINLLIDIIITTFRQFKDQQNIIHNKLIQSNNSIYVKILTLESMINELRRKVNLLESTVSKFGLKINTHEIKMTKLIDEAIIINDLRTENQKLKRILKRQKNTQLPR